MHGSKLEKITFRPSIIAVFFPTAVSVALGAIAVTLKSTLGLPLIAWGFVATFAFLWATHAVSVSLFFVSFSTEGIVSRWFIKKEINWKSIRKWSDYSKNSTLYFQTKDGKVHELLGYCVFGNRRAIASEFFHRHIGEPAIGKEAVVPDWIKSVLDVVGPPGSSEKSQ